jgi:hypothetical protein
MPIKKLKGTIQNLNYIKAGLNSDRMQLEVRELGLKSQFDAYM